MKFAKRIILHVEDNEFSMNTIDSINNLQDDNKSFIAKKGITKKYEIKYKDNSYKSNACKL